jgi:uncharacterized protein YecE (DUF72 family)
MGDDIRIGTSGWHYPTGAGTWNGSFYPKPRPKGFDELTYYAERFDTVEINTTFYGQPRAEVSAQWAARTPPHFEFAVKLYQQFTHPKMFRARVARTLERALETTGIPESAITALAAANQTDADAFRRGIAPLAEAGKLGVLLAQFPASYRDTPDNRAQLATLLRLFNDHAIAVELRHRSWSDHAAATRQVLESFGAAWTWIDEPKFSDSVRQPTLGPGPLAYLRLHGRNARSWWSREDRDARYDYLYSTEELAPIAAEIAAAAELGTKVRAYLNNHPNARAVTNAEQLKALAAVEVESVMGKRLPRPI